MMIERYLPINIKDIRLKIKSSGLVIIDPLNGFCKPGCGPLAPPAPDKAIEEMISYVDFLARFLAGYSRPILVLADSHRPGVPEPPYPPHCEEGTEQAMVVDQLCWMLKSEKVTIIRKDCMDGFIGGIKIDSGFNVVVDWVNKNKLESIIVTGICTDICVLDFVATLLSARNHGMTPGLKDVVVYVFGCATYDLPRVMAENLGLPETAIHPRDITNHIGLYVMALRGAILSDHISFIF